MNNMMNMNLLLKTAFKRKRVLITGHTGFKGSWLALWLSKLGAEVFGYSLPPPTTPSHYSCARIHELLSGEVIADIRDRSALTSTIDNFNPHLIFHMAAQALVRPGYAHPIDTFDTNIMGSANILEVVRQSGAPRIVIMITSDKCYEQEAVSHPFFEGDRLGGDDPYSASKAAAEIVINAYRLSYFQPEKIIKHKVKIASVRAGNVIGGGDFATDRIIPDIVRSLSDNLPIWIRNPPSIRPWQHVLEPLSGYMLLGAKMMKTDDPALCSSWNFGPLEDQSLPVSELVNMFISRWNTGSWVDVSDLNAPHEAPCLRLSIRKAQENLGWEPRWDIRTTVEKTVDWYKEYLELPDSSMQ
ncbi:MAG: CDP-glucose 4,6-dehydratase, partial [Methanoregula sp.]|nr:CDP-glucose 4,6-dehydratase [Methanoregula sp.]